MVIKVLTENNALRDTYACEHGLSLYIEVKAHNILFDMGQTDVFIKNASKLGVDIEAVDLGVISHGHYDHGGGLGRFLNMNSCAQVYVNKEGFNRFFSDRDKEELIEIGLDRSLAKSEQVRLVGEAYEIDDDLLLFSGVKGLNHLPTGNQRLYKMVEGSYNRDDFAHEQSLLIREGNKTVLIAGCAHRGIINILEHIRSKGYDEPTHIIGGFHLASSSQRGQAESTDVIDDISAYLQEANVECYTCHCTGRQVYTHMKEILMEKIHYLSAGSVVEIK